LKYSADNDTTGISPPSLASISDYQSRKLHLCLCLLLYFFNIPVVLVIFTLNCTLAIY